jgi:Mg2+-importing ATPase
VSFKDPIKASTSEAIKNAQTLGVTVKILTGDSAEVAGAVAKSIGLLKDEENVMTGAAFEALKQDERLEAARTHHVFARVSPEQKHAVIQALEQQYEVGFLGEGINDAPALKAANVGIVVQGASDVAREAADVVLLQQSLEVIVSGIREGREVFANTLKYIKATLASNFGNFYAVAISSFLIPSLPMLPIQILLLNLLSDFPMIAIATDTVWYANVY